MVSGLKKGYDPFPWISSEPGVDDWSYAPQDLADVLDSVGQAQSVLRGRTSEEVFKRSHELDLLVARFQDETAVAARRRREPVPEFTQQETVALIPRTPRDNWSLDEDMSILALRSINDGISIAERGGDLVHAASCFLRGASCLFPPRAWSLAMTA